MKKRYFIQKIIKLGVFILSPGLLKAKNRPEPGAKVKMLTSEGKLVWVELPADSKKTSGQPITNKALYSWIRKFNYGSRK